jgi:hypothetical protein
MLIALSLRGKFTEKRIGNLLEMGNVIRITEPLCEMSRSTIEDPLERISWCLSKYLRWRHDYKGSLACLGIITHFQSISSKPGAFLLRFIKKFKLQRTIFDKLLIILFLTLPLLASRNLADATVPCRLGSIITWRSEVYCFQDLYKQRKLSGMLPMSESTVTYLLGELCCVVVSERREDLLCRCVWV